MTGALGRLVVPALFLAGALLLISAEKPAAAGKPDARPILEEVPAGDAGERLLAPEEEAEDGDEAEDKESEEGSAPAGAAEKLPPRSKNLEIPADLEEKPRKSLEEAIAGFEEVLKSRKGKGPVLDKAISRLKSSSASLPSSPLPLYYLGIAYQWKRNFPEARRVLEKAVKLNPSFHEAFLELGDVHC